MFRPNRIGTPWAHSVNSADSNVNFTLGANAIAALAQPANIINAVPALDFNRYSLNWQGTESLPAGNKCAFMHQFTVTRPIQGDAVGLELVGAIRGTFPDNAIIRPIVGKLAAAATSVMQDLTLTDVPTSFGTPAAPDGGTGAAQWRAHSYQEQMLVHYTPAEGVFAHGFEICNIGAGAVNISALKMDVWIRQLNDQQDIGYRDTLR